MLIARPLTVLNYLYCIGVDWCYKYRSLIRNVIFCYAYTAFQLLFLEANRLIWHEMVPKKGLKQFHFNSYLHYENFNMIFFTNIKFPAHT